MPQLLVFLPCEKVLISGGETGDGTTTVVTILQSISVSIPKDSGPHLAAPMTWHIFVLWKTPIEDRGVAFEQNIDLLAPSGEAVMRFKTDFTASTEFQRTTTKVIGLPVSEEGNYILHLQLVRADDPDLILTDAKYPLLIQHQKDAVDGSEAVAGDMENTKV